MEQHLKINKNFKAIIVCSRIFTITPISILFYQAHGLSFSQIMIMRIATFLSTSLIELPSGYIGDRIGYKKVVQIGLYLTLLSCLGHIFSDSFTSFMIWKIMWGVGLAMLSGADEAWYYASLMSLGRENQYGNNISEAHSMVQFITAFSLIISSALFFLDIRLPFAFNAIFFCVALVATKNLKDNKQLHNIKSVQGKKNNFSLESIYQIINHTNIYFLFADVLFVSTTIFMFETYQPQMTESNIPVSYFGIIYFLFSLITGFGARFYSFIENKYANVLKFDLKYYFFLVVLQALSSLAVCFFSSNTFIILLIFSIQEFIFGYFRVYSNVAINKNVDNAYRATILSVKSLLNSVFKIIIFMILGKIMDRYYLNTTYVVIALVFLIGGILIGFIAKVNAFIFLFSNRSRE